MKEKKKYSWWDNLDPFVRNFLLAIVILTIVIIVVIVFLTLSLPETGY
tara:strand:+ start:2234 stop:2377 length:144 start_codon:yes stop_codon:yes gene_type:complete